MSDKHLQQNLKISRISIIKRLAGNYYALFDNVIDHYMSTVIKILST